jgi:hypothetical protein
MRCHVRTSDPRLSLPGSDPGPAIPLRRPAGPGRIVATVPRVLALFRQLARLGYRGVPPAPVPDPAIPAPQPASGSGPTGIAEGPTLEPISDAQVEQLVAEVQGAMADIAEAWREKDSDGPIDDEREAAIDRAMARLRRVEEQLSGLRPAPG